MPVSVPIIPRRRASVPAAPTRRATAQYMRPDSSGLLAGWPVPPVRDASIEVRRAWGAVAARAVDTLHNDGWVKGGFDQIEADSVGSELQLTPAPLWKRCGFASKEDARKWASEEARPDWVAYSTSPSECDDRGRLTVTQMAGSITRCSCGFGEGLARVLSSPRDFSETDTRIQLVSPHRLKLETREEKRLYQGVFLDPEGPPKAYLFRARKGGIDQDVVLPARDRDGRRLVIHVHNGEGDSTRGISELAPVLRRVRQYDQLSDGTLTAALLQTIIVATLQSKLPSAEAFEGVVGDASSTTNDLGDYLGAKAEFWSEKKSIDLGVHGRINQLFPHEEFKLHGAEHPSDNYLPFSRNLLREIARCLGITYEALTLDHEGATYSSSRMGVSTIWPVVVRRRSAAPYPFVRAVYDAHLEEQIFKGRVWFPGGYENFLACRPYATRAILTGPPKPSADALKDAKAMGERLERKITAPQHECAELGLNYEQVLDDWAEADRLAAERGLPRPSAPKGSPLAGVSLDDIEELNELNNQ